MPKVEIDYSNTLFYKIYCVNPDITDMYIGHTTNFVQRKHGHKQCCINAKSINYNSKLYTYIRNHGGWENWNMEIIAFHNCKDKYAARKYEQDYFKQYKATLNTIQPFKPPQKKIEREIKEPNDRERTFVEPLYCDICIVHLSSTKSLELHNKTKKHIYNLGEQAKVEENKKLRAELEEMLKQNQKWRLEHLERMNEIGILPITELRKMFKLLKEQYKQNEKEQYEKYEKIMIENERTTKEMEDMKVLIEDMKLVIKQLSKNIVILRSYKNNNMESSNILEKDN